MSGREISGRVTVKRLWIIGNSKSGKSTFAKRCSNRFGIPIFEAGKFCRELNPEMDNTRLADYCTRILQNDDNHRFFSDKIKEGLGEDSYVIVGVRNPVDFLDSFDPYRDFVIFLEDDSEPASEFEKLGIEAIKRIMDFFVKLNISTDWQVTNLKAEKDKSIWYDETRFTEWNTCKGEWQILWK